MAPSNPLPPTVAVATRLYRRLLGAYSASYRQIVGDEQAQTFEDCCLFVYDRDGNVGLFLLLIANIRDLLLFALIDRVESLKQPVRRIIRETAYLALPILGIGISDLWWHFRALRLDFILIGSLVYVLMLLSVLMLFDENHVADHASPSPTEDQSLRHSRLDILHANRGGVSVARTIQHLMSDRKFPFARIAVKSHTPGGLTDGPH